MTDPVLKKRTVTIPIWQGDDLAEISHLKRAVLLAERQAAEAIGAPARLGDVGEGEAAVEVARRAYDAFVAEAAERAVQVELQPIRNRRFRELLAEHPARTQSNGEPHPDDVIYEADSDTMALPLIAACMVAPAFSSDAAREEFLEELPEGDRDQLFSNAFWLNKSQAADPFASTYYGGTPS
jgi:hypothetical protein